MLAAPTFPAAASPALPAREAYRLWAPRYAAETAISHLENLTVCALDVATAGRSVLDVGCGTTRRLSGSGAAFAIGMDLSPEMLGKRTLDARARKTSVVAADGCAVPFAPASFDVVWCRLMIGHVRDLRAVYAELSRVCVAGGSVVVSDVTPEAIAAGHRRTFVDVDGRTREVDHVVHTSANHAAAAGDAG
ncbi:MAG TPA: class I SAM-dependent methyltransferase, partial [Gemmatimonadaceae bacterium]|nr:class I SAM-dependent methyltransferase [Gemmatimonadaceae bacterium]